MPDFKLIKNKNAQVGETLTWIVATIVIIILLIIFVYAVYAISKTKNISFSLGGFVADEGSSLAKQQMLFAILEKDGGKIKKLLLDGKSSDAKSEILKLLADFKNRRLDCKLKNKIIKINREELGLDCKITV